MGEHLAPRDVGKAEVQDDQVRLQGLGESNGLTTVAGLAQHLEPAANPQCRAYQAAHVDDVVDQQDTDPHSRSLGTAQPTDHPEQTDLSFVEWCGSARSWRLTRMRIGGPGSAGKADHERTARLLRGALLVEGLAAVDAGELAHDEEA